MTLRAAKIRWPEAGGTPRYEAQPVANTNQNVRSPFVAVAIRYQGPVVSSVFPDFRYKDERCEMELRSACTRIGRAVASYNQYRNHGSLWPVHMQLEELQHYENHVAKKYADTNNNRLT